MLIKALQKTTLLDYPGKVACIIFTAGCNFRCPFCHNPELVSLRVPMSIGTKQSRLPRRYAPRNDDLVSEDEILEFLQTRIGKLDGVVITGGEPTIHKDLPEFLKKIKDLGFLVKLDTNGTNSQMVETLIKDGLVDYVAMDYKGPIEKYTKYIFQNQKSKIKNQNYKLKVKRTIEILFKSGIDFELRTTVVPTLHTKEDLTEMAKELKKMMDSGQARMTSFWGSPPVGGRLQNQILWYLQNFRSNKCLDKSFEKIKSYPKEFYGKILPELKKYMPKTETR